MKDFYYPRWNLFVSQLGTALSSGQSFNYDNYVTTVEQLEWSWSIANNSYSPTPVGNSIQIAQQLLEKYLPLLGAQEPKKNTVSFN